LRTIEVEGARAERRQSAVAEIREHLTRLYRGFVGWASLYGDTDAPDELERRQPVVHLVDEFSKQYLPRSMWLMETNRKKIETFISKAEELCSEFSAEIEARGYHRVRRSMEKRVSKKLRPLKNRGWIRPRSRTSRTSPPERAAKALAEACEYFFGATPGEGDAGPSVAVIVD
jgi:hypothetical protein